MRELLLSLAVQGKLVPQDPEDEPAEEIESVRKLKSAASVIKNDYPFALPCNWQWKRLGQVSKLINGDRSKNYPNKAEYVQDVKNLVAKPNDLPKKAIYNHAENSIPLRGSLWGLSGADKHSDILSRSSHSHEKQTVGHGKYRSIILSVSSAPLWFKLQRLTGDGVSFALAPLPGCGEYLNLVAGGVARASLNHRLQDVIPSGWRFICATNQQMQIIPV